MGYPTVQLCTVLDIRVYIISEVKLIFKVLGYSMGNFRLARPMLVYDLDYFLLLGKLLDSSIIPALSNISVLYFLPSAANNFSWLVALTN